MDAFTVAKHRFHHAEVFMVITDSAADHRIRFTALYHDRPNHRGVGDHRTLRLLLGNASTLHDLVVLAPVLFKARIGFIVDDLKIDACFDLQPQFLNAHFDYARTADQDRLRQSQRDQFLRCVQHTRLFPFRQHDTLRCFACLRENRLHEQVSFVDKFRQLVDISVKVGNGTHCHAGIHRRFGNRWCDFNNQTRVERFWNDVFRAEAQILVAIGRGHDFALLGMRQFGNGMDRSQLHLFVDCRRANVQCATENEREAQDVVDLVRVVGTAGTDDGVRTHRFCQRRQNFRFRVSQRQNHRRAGHFLDHLLGQHFRA